jgi:hypothetical protein
MGRLVEVAATGLHAGERQASGVAAAGFRGGPGHLRLPIGHSLDRMRVCQLNPRGRPVALNSVTDPD